MTECLSTLLHKGIEVMQANHYRQGRGAIYYEVDNGDAFACAWGAIMLGAGVDLKTTSLHEGFKKIQELCPGVGEIVPYRGSIRQKIVQWNDLDQMRLGEIEQELIKLGV